MSETKNAIVIKGARMHNLKNVDIAIPRNKLVVITGLSGSGKSSLAFDTLYAEGQRRYVESLSSYARQFLGRIHKPEMDYIKGIPPAIAIEQKVNTRNPRSTVGTSTEIYDYLKLLFARIGKTISPISGTIVKQNSVTDVVDFVLALPEKTRLMVLCPLVEHPERTLFEQLQIILQQGFARVELTFKKGKFENGDYKLSDILDNETLIKNISHTNIIIDRLLVSNEEDNISRMSDSIQTAFFEGKGQCFIKVGEEVHSFSNRFEADGIVFEEPNVHTFSFNNPLGACPTCQGFGNVLGIDEDLVVPNKRLSIYEDAVVCWRSEKMSDYKNILIKKASKFDFPIHKPYNQLSEELKEILWNGNQHFKGINGFFKDLESQPQKIQYRILLARYRGKTTCPDCKGTRLKKQASYVRINGKSIHELVLLSINELSDFFQQIELSEYEITVSKRILIEIRNRLQFLVDVGLGYLTLNRLSSTLSGGESQRINLATSLGSSLIGSMYILDEPSIGLHSRDTQRLIKVLRQLQHIGNTVIVVEHDEDIMRAADELIDIGPAAGILGGEVVFQGTYQKMLDDVNKEGNQSKTSKYLTGVEQIEIPQNIRPWTKCITVCGAYENNLKDITVRFPLNVFTVVTGVSGSGKSSLVNTVLYAALARMYHERGETVGKYEKLEGAMTSISNVEMVDQNPIGKSSRSNPVTYIKAYDEIRKLFSLQPLSTTNNFSASHFSFNVAGGRCEECEGEGIITVEMQFMADIHLVCESCKGKRFKDEVLEVQYKGKNIFDVLEMSVDEAVDFFGQSQESTEKRIVNKLGLLQAVGLGYIKLGQSSNTLSGGESQRVKLASFLGKEKGSEPTLFIFDEPTTGLHFDDIKKLLKSFNDLIDNGNTIVVIEHNLDVIKCADWIIDLGVEGGNAGGNLVFEGTVKDILHCENSYTAHYLKEKIRV